MSVYLENCILPLRTFLVLQSLHRLEKYLNLEGFLEKSLKVKSVLKCTGKSLKSLENSLNSTIFVGLSSVDINLNH